MPAPDLRPWRTLAAAMLASWLAGSLQAVEFTGCFELSADRVLLHAHALPGVPVDGYFILDTGSSIVAVDTRCGSLLRGTGELMRAGMSDGSSAMRIQQTAPFDVGGLHVRAGLLGTVFDLAYVSAIEGYTALGLIGYPVLAGKVIDIDPDAGTCGIFDAMPQGLDLRTFDRLHCVIAHAGQIRVEMPVAGHRMLLLLDTGKPGFLDLSPDAFDMLAQDGSLADDPDNLGVAGSQRRFGRFKNLAIGAYHFAACTASTAGRSHPRHGIPAGFPLHHRLPWLVHLPEAEPGLCDLFARQQAAAASAQGGRAGRDHGHGGIACAAVRAAIRPHAARDRWPSAHGHGFQASVPAPERLAPRPGHPPCR